MFLDHELREIQAAKARLGARCDLQRQVVRLEIHSAWAAFRRKLGYASLGLSLGLYATEYVLGTLRRRKLKDA